MRTVAMIPIKMNSERVPGKNIKAFDDGTPLMKLIQQACLDANLIDEVFVYCSNPAIREYLDTRVRFLQRPEYLDGDSCNCNDIIREFISEVDADIYVASHATGPFTKGSSIDACINAVVSGGYDSAFMAKKMQEFLWVNGEALNFDIQHFPRTQDMNPIFSEAPGAYVFSKDTFVRYGRRVGIKPYIHASSTIECIDIDYPEDFEIANAIYMNIIKNNQEGQLV